MMISSTSKEWGVNGAASRTVDLGQLKGKRMRFSAMVKSKDLANWGGLGMYAMGNEKLVLVDDMGGRPIVGTTDWTRYEIVADVPEEADIMSVSVHMYGAGQMWMDDAKIEIVGNDVPITDDSGWHGWSFSSPHYSSALDPAVQRNGHATICLSSTVAKSGEWYAWDWNDRHPDPYRGKKIHMTAWMKTENVTGASGLNLRILDGHLNNVAPVVKKTVRGTSDWKLYEITADIPEGTEDICSGFRLVGKGKLWFVDVKYEVVEGK